MYVSSLFDCIGEPELAVGDDIPQKELQSIEADYREYVAVVFYLTGAADIGGGVRTHVVFVRSLTNVLAARVFPYNCVSLRNFLSRADVNPIGVKQLNTNDKRTMLGLIWCRCRLCAQKHVF